MANYLDAAGLNIYHNGATINEKKLPATLYAQDIPSKNLLPQVVGQQSYYGVTFITNEDGSITVNGTATADSRTYASEAIVLPPGTYVFSGCPSGGSLTTYRADIRVSQGGEIATDADNVQIINTGTDLTIRFTSRFIGYYTIRIEHGYTANNLVFYPMIRRANAPAGYIPYAKTNIELTNKTYLQHFRSKNLLRRPYQKGQTLTRNGVNFTIQHDGSITAVGTASGGEAALIISDMFAYEMPAGTYVASGCEGGSSSTYYLQFDYYNNSETECLGAYVYNGDVQYTFPTASAGSYNGHCRSYIVIKEGVTVSGATFFPMVRQVQDPPGYFDYVRTNEELSNPMATFQGETFVYKTGVILDTDQGTRLSEWIDNDTLHGLAVTTTGTTTDFCHYTASFSTTVNRVPVIVVVNHQTLGSNAAIVQGYLNKDGSAAFTNSKVTASNGNITIDAGASAYAPQMIIYPKQYATVND